MKDVMLTMLLNTSECHNNAFKQTQTTLLTNTYQHYISIQHVALASTCVYMCALCTYVLQITNVRVPPLVLVSSS